MGVDLYVGTLSRYYTRRWETAQQQIAKSLGAPTAKVISPDGAHPMKGLSYGEGHRIVQGWRAQFARALRKGGVEGGGWPEDVAQPYSTVQLVWHGFGALMLWAAYDEAPGLMPREIKPEEWQDDPAFKSVLDPSSRYSALYGVHAWLPLSMAGAARTTMPAGEERVFASVKQLALCLEQLNSRTWGVTPETREAWLAEAKESTGFESHARGAFDCFRRQAEFAMEVGLPIMFDY